MSTPREPEDFDEVENEESIDDTGPQDSVQNPNIELQPPTAKSSLEPQHTSPTTSAAIIPLNDFRGMSLNVSLKELQLKKGQSAQNLNIEVQPPTTENSLDPQQISTTNSTTTHVANIHLNDFRGMSIHNSSSKELQPKAQLPKADHSEFQAADILPLPIDKDIMKSFDAGGQEVRLTDFRGLDTSSFAVGGQEERLTDFRGLETSSFNVGGQEVRLTDFRGLITSLGTTAIPSQTEEPNEDEEDDMSQGWNIHDDLEDMEDDGTISPEALLSFFNPPNSQEIPTLHRIMSASEIMEIPETPARQALSRVALNDDVMDPIIHHLEISANQDPFETETQPVMYRCPSIISSLKSPKADVYLYLYPEHRMISRECRLDATIYQIKQAISRYIGVPPEKLDITRHNHVCHDERNLLELGAKPNARVLFHVDVNKRLAFAENRNALQRMIDYEPKVLEPRPDTIRRVTCMVKDASGKWAKKRLLVTVVHPTIAKPMIGGYYDKKADVTYHHAATSPDPEPQSISCTSNEACQTHSDKHLWTQTNMEKANQTVRPDLYLSETGDRVLYAKRHYISADTLQTRRNYAAIVIQKYWRRWLAITERKRRLAELVRSVEWLENIRKERVERREKLIREEMERQLNPKSLLDLELLYRAINKWRNEETEYILTNRWGIERKAALAQIAEMEADLLQNLDKVRNQIINRNEEKGKQKQFMKMGQPHRWLGYKSLFVSYDTEGRLMARYLHSLYKSLNMPVINTPEGLQNRLILLEEITEQVRKGDKAMQDVIRRKKPRHLIDMIHDLIGREMRFISTKCSAGLISATRKRIANTFFCLCRDPYFNPEAQRCDPVSYNKEKLCQMVPCKSCMRMQSRDSFTIIKGTTVTQSCKSCMGLYRTAILRSDLNLFRQLLKEMRQEELSVGIVNSVTSLIDANDIKFLFEQIWGSQSALSGIDNRYFLRLCRWRKNEPWAPWNCVLFTDEEAAIHLELETFEQAYQPTFLHKIQVQHARARLYFAGLAKYSMHMDYEMAKLNCEAVMPPKKDTSQFRPSKRSRRVKRKH